MLFLVLHIRKPSAVPFLKVDDEDEGYHCIDQAGEWMFLFRLWSIMFVAKAVGQAIINTHIATVAQQLFRVPVDDAYWYIQQLLSEYFEIQAPKMWLQGGSFGPNGWCWTKKAKLRFFWRFERCPHWPMMIQNAHDDSYVYSELNMLLFEVLPFKDKSEWGRCSDNCPLTGPQKANLGKLVTWEFA